MPLVGFNCQKHGQFSFEKALTGHCDCTPRFLLDSVINVVRRDYHKGHIITATTLLGCLRETYLSRKYDYFATIKQVFYSWRGTLVHRVLYRPDLKDWISEQKYSKTVTVNKRKIQIDGTLDGYDKLTKTLWDIKTVGDNGISFIVREGAKEDHEPQVNIYRWLCPFEVKRLRIIYLSMMTFAQTGQLNETTQKLKNDPDKKKYGYEYFIAPKKRDHRGFGAYVVGYNTPEVKMWSDKKVVSFIKPRARAMLDAFENDVLPPMCDEKTRKWKCPSYCVVNNICKDLEKEL